MTSLDWNRSILTPILGLSSSLGASRDTNARIHSDDDLEAVANSGSGDSDGDHEQQHDVTADGANDKFVAPAAAGESDVNLLT